MSGVLFKSGVQITRIRFSKSSSMKKKQSKEHNSNKTLEIEYIFLNTYLVESGSLFIWSCIPLGIFYDTLALLFVIFDSSDGLSGKKARRSQIELTIDTIVIEL